MDIKFGRGMKISESTLVTEVIFTSEEWVIFRLNHNNYGICISSALMEKTKKYSSRLAEFIKAKVKPYKGAYLFVGKPEYKVYSAENGPYADNYDEIMSFCNAFARVFGADHSSSYSDLIYVEEFDVMLPIDSDTVPSKGEEQLLAMWLTDGLNLNKLDINQLGIVSSWMSKTDIIKAIKCAGIEVDELEFDEKETAVDQQSNLGRTLDVPFVLPGRDILTKYFNDQIIDFIKNMAKYERMGISSMPATLLYGKPGCGKTYAVNKLAEYLKLPVFEINSSSVASPYIHDTSKKIGEVFASAIEAAPSILIIDEIEAYLTSRDKAGGGNHKIEEVDEFLRNIPKAIEAKVIIFGMTNMLDLLDPAILRKGRFDSVQEVGMPTNEEIVDVLKFETDNIPITEGINFEDMAKKLCGRPMSDISYIVRQAARIAVKNDCEKISQENFDEAIESLGKSNDRVKKKIIGFHD